MSDKILKLFFLKLVMCWQLDILYKINIDYEEEIQYLDHIFLIYFWITDIGSTINENKFMVIWWMKITDKIESNL